MNLLRGLLFYIFILVFLFCKVEQASAANDKSPVYMFGIVTSFTDSVLYMTQVQYVDSAYLTKKNFLYGRGNYSSQLKNYMKNMGIENPTCITIYDFKKDKVEKKYSKIRKKFSEKDKYIVKYLAADEFQFNPIIPTESELTEEKAGIPDKKKKDKKSKKGKK